MFAPPVLLPRNLPPTARVATLDARGAAAEGLGCYLRSLTFRRWGGEGAPDTEFRIETVHDEWPEPSAELVYPSASILDRADPVYAAHSLVPTPLEETIDRFGAGTVLWKTGEAVCEFQVDVWASDIGTREAIAARLPAAFAPGEDGARVIVKGSERYYNRPVRLALLTLPRRMDQPDSVYVRERRLMVTVQATIDVVDLRCAVLLAPTVRVNVIEPPEPMPEPPMRPESDRVD